MIAYKGNLVKVNPKNTSKTCHCCGFINSEVVLGVNEWKCPICGESHDRDINAALNILSKYVTSQSIVGQEATEISNACGEPRSSVKQESEQTSSVSS
jgi:transposase